MWMCKTRCYVCDAVIGQTVSEAKSIGTVLSTVAELAVFLDVRDSSADGSVPW